MKTFKKSFGAGSYDIIQNGAVIGRVYKDRLGLWTSNINGEQRNATTLKALKRYVNV